MTETIDVANAGRSDITLPCGTKVPQGATVPVLLDNLVAHQDHPVVRHLFAERILRADGPMPERREIRDAMAGMQDEISRLQDLLDSERQGFDAERDSLTQERDAALAAYETEQKARADAEAAAKAAGEELAKLKKAAKAS